MPTPTSSLNAFVATATKAARLAAREITRAAQDRDQLEITDKARNDFVTSANKAAEAAICGKRVDIRFAGFRGDRRGNGSTIGAEV